MIKIAYMYVSNFLINTILSYNFPPVLSNIAYIIQAPIVNRLRDAVLIGNFFRDPFLFKIKIFAKCPLMKTLRTNGLGWNFRHLCKIFSLTYTDFFNFQGQFKETFVVTKIRPTVLVCINSAWHPINGELVYVCNLALPFFGINKTMFFLYMN